jgi:hypothetical protein
MVDNCIRKFVRIGGSFAKERLHIRKFKYNSAMHRFLSTKDNSVYWRETTSDMPNKTGIYVFAGGKYHNVKDVDATALVHM